MKKCIIIIPTHTFDLKDYEVMSLKQILSFYQNKYDDIDIAITFPWNLDIHELEKYNIDINSILSFQQNLYWFENEHQYNRLCIHNDLYSIWKNDYEYMLIYQLDSFMFKDELYYWCNKGYDYIGGYDYLDNYNYNNLDDNKLYFTLNGGFSLRKISKFNEITKDNNLMNELDETYFWEDRVFTHKIYKNKLTIKLEDLFKFSIDIRIYQSNYFNLIYPDLPFGCHRFHISKFVYNLCKENINYKE